MLIFLRQVNKFLTWDFQISKIQVQSPFRSDFIIEIGDKCIFGPYGLRFYEIAP
jgi:hypothetical protein